MRRFDTVLFDLDGTLLDTLEDICGAANHTLRELGYPERTLAEMRRFVGNGAEMQMRRALGADADEETVAKALALYKPYYAAHCQIKTKPYAGVLELMAALKAEGFRLAVVSNKPDEAVRPLVAKHFGALADIAMGETAQRRRKPAPDMVNDALAALGADKSRAVYVGDSEVDIETARNAGIPCISVTWGFRGNSSWKRKRPSWPPMQASFMRCWKNEPRHKKRRPARVCAFALHFYSSIFTDAARAP